MHRSSNLHKQIIMCTQGTTRKYTLPNGKEIVVDMCIYSLIRILNENYKITKASCCGHGKQPISIVFMDDTELRIMSFDQAREVDKLFPPIN